MDTAKAAKKLRRQLEAYYTRIHIYPDKTAEIEALLRKALDAAANGGR